MSDCCTPGSARYERVFDERFAHDRAQRYRRHGLTSIEHPIVDRLASMGLVDRTVLEIGGGVGEIQLELLARGAAATTNLELSGAYEPDARALLAERGFAERATRHVGLDLAANAQRIDTADYVVLHRVVCCYPDSKRLLEAAAAHARRAVVFSHPPRTWLTLATVGLDNAWMRARGRDYRGYVHSPEAMYGVLRRAGFELHRLRAGPRWWVVAATRT